MSLKEMFGNHMQAKMFQRVWEWQEKDKLEFMKKMEAADQYALIPPEEEDADVL